MILHIQVKPNAALDAISLNANGIIVVKIKAPPMDGKANKHLIQYLSTIFKIPKSKITIIKGENSKFKTLEIQADSNYVNQVIENK
jgi:uncharacterized protein (TIGR00251 family)